VCVILGARTCEGGGGDLGDGIAQSQHQRQGVRPGAYDNQWHLA